MWLYGETTQGESREQFRQLRHGSTFAVNIFCVLLTGPVASGTWKRGKRRNVFAFFRSIMASRDTEKSKHSDFFDTLQPFLPF